MPDVIVMSGSIQRYLLELRLVILRYIKKHVLLTTAPCVVYSWASAPFKCSFLLQCAAVLCSFLEVIAKVVS